MDSPRFRQPRLAISCTNSLTGGEVSRLCALLSVCFAVPGRLRAVEPVRGLFSYSLAPRARDRRRLYELTLRFFCCHRASAARSPIGSDGKALSIAAVTSAIGAMPLTVRSTPCAGNRRSAARSARGRPRAGCAARPDCRRRAAPRRAPSFPRSGFRSAEAGRPRRPAVRSPRRARDRLARQHAVERLGLRHGARKTVENETLARIGLLDALGDDADHDLDRAPVRRSP